RHEVARVVRVARHVAVAVVDLDELAVALALAGPDDDARRDRHHLGAGASGEVDALMERAPTGERVRTLTETGRDIAGRDRPAVGTHFRRQLAIEQQALEDVELAMAVLELELEALERAQDAAQIELIGVGQDLL